MANLLIELYPPVVPQTYQPYIPTGDREEFKLIAVGAAEGIREMIHGIYLCGIAEAGARSQESGRLSLCPEDRPQL